MPGDGLVEAASRLLERLPTASKKQMSQNESRLYLFEIKPMRQRQKTRN